MCIPVAVAITTWQLRPPTWNSGEALMMHGGDGGRLAEGARGW